MYANFPGREKMRKRGCMLSGGDLDAARTMWCRNPGYGSGRIYFPMLACFLLKKRRDGAGLSRETRISIVPNL